MFCSFSLLAQKKSIGPQFDFEQIDSLAENAIKKISAADSQATAIVYSKWDVGSYSMAKDNYSRHENHFDIYILTLLGERHSIQKIDNFGYFKTEKANLSEVQQFFIANAGKMKKEELGPKVDTTYLNEQHTSMSISQTINSHELQQKVAVSSPQAAFNYEYAPGYSKNKYNLQTSRFKLMELIEAYVRTYEKEQHEREKVVYKE